MKKAINTPLKTGKTGPSPGPGKINSAFQGLNPKNISPQTQKQSEWIQSSRGVYTKRSVIEKLQTKPTENLGKHDLQKLQNLGLKPQTGEAGDSIKTPLQLSANAKPAAPGAPIKTPISSNALPRTPLQQGEQQKLNLGPNLKNSSSTDSPKKPRTKKQQQEIKEKRAARKEAKKTRKAEAKQKKQAAEAEAAKKLTESTPSPKQTTSTVPVNIQAAIRTQKTSSNFATQATEGPPRIPDQYQAQLQKYEAKQKRYTQKYESKKYNIASKHYINSQKLAITQQSLATQVAEYEKKHPPGSKPHITVNPFKILSRALSKNKYKRNLRSVGDYNTKQRQINSERNSKLSRIESKEDRKKKMINAKKSLVLKQIQKGLDSTNFQNYTTQKIDMYAANLKEAEGKITTLQVDIDKMKNDPKNKKILVELEKKKAFYEDSKKHYTDKKNVQEEKQRKITDTQKQLTAGVISQEKFDETISKMAADSRGFTKGSHGKEEKKQKQRDKYELQNKKRAYRTQEFTNYTKGKINYNDTKQQAVNKKEALIEEQKEILKYTSKVSSENQYLNPITKKPYEPFEINNMIIDLNKKILEQDEIIKTVSPKIERQTKKNLQLANLNSELKAGNISKELHDKLVSNMSKQSKAFEEGPDKKGKLGIKSTDQKRKALANKMIQIQESEIKSEQTIENYKTFVDSKLDIAKKEKYAVNKKLGSLRTKINPDPNDIAKIEELQKLKVQHETDIKTYKSLKFQITTLEKLPTNAAISEIGKLASKSNKL